MEKIEYKNIYVNEGNHFFYVSTHRLVTDLIKKWGRKEKFKILDAGCGTGGLAVKLASLGEVSAIDASPEAIKFAKIRGVGAKLASIGRIPFPDKSFDVVTCIDVIYHKQVKDDVGALSEIRRVLKPGGLLILRVPANKFLMSAHDRHVHTARRYDRPELIAKIVKSGLDLRFITFVHSPIFFGSLVKIFIEKIIDGNDHSAIGGTGLFLNKFLTTALNLEGALISRGVSLPVGQGLIAVATR